MKISWHSIAATCRSRDQACIQFSEKAPEPRAGKKVSALIGQKRDCLKDRVSPAQFVNHGRAGDGCDQ
jgi:hypothetical protein